jgi:hypothetical protein
MVCPRAAFSMRLSSQNEISQPPTSSFLDKSRHSVGFVRLKGKGTCMLCIVCTPVLHLRHPMWTLFEVTRFQQKKNVNKGYKLDVHLQKVNFLHN